MLEELKNAKKVVGFKQLRKALNASLVSAVYLAEDADPAMTGVLQKTAEAGGVPVIRAETMRQLGAACGIDVGAACAAILK